ncbi:hypothetical protein J2Z22_001944 [Paenibacillus forsythiae]|uniref:DUF2568 domain-containing protein n=1 Tax=Paenibacillus forsythiae TaxID=365616 RepID=A0ABU3H6G7_9BACL|nr:YrdB family protein [Paenibacillus forsythiae]MDT3426418.1 hypothetical protein [Paenibacillus forsythiae]
MIETLKMFNLGLRFVLELVVLTVYGFYGYRLGWGAWSQRALGIGLPLAAAVLWGLLGAPKATFALPAPLHQLLELLMFGLPAALLLRMNHPALAVLYGAVVLGNKLLMIVISKL